MRRGDSLSVRLLPGHAAHISYSTAGLVHTYRVTGSKTVQLIQPGGMDNMLMACSESTSVGSGERI